MSKFALKGIIVALLTPFDAHDNVDEERLRSHIDFLFENMVHGLFPCGSTGEGPKLRTKERNKVIDLVVDQANSRVPVLAGVSAASTVEAVESAKYAQDAGADAAVILPPYYYHSSQQALKEHYETIARATNLPIFLYNIPEFAGYFLSVDLVAKLAEDKIIAGLKDSSGDMIRFQELVRVLGDKVALLQGQEPLYVPSFILGTSAAVSGDANLAPRLAVQVYEDYMKADMKRALEHQFNLSLLDKALSTNFIETIKQGMTSIGRPFGHARKPATPLTESDCIALEKVLISLGLRSP